MNAASHVSHAFAEVRLRADGRNTMHPLQLNGFGKSFQHLTNRRQGESRPDKPRTKQPPVNHIAPSGRVIPITRCLMPL